MDKKIIKCAECGKKIELYPSQIGRKKYCSKECMKKVKGYGGVIKVCENCGDEYKVVSARVERSRFCSKKCMAEYNNYNEVQIRTCPVCGTTFESLVEKSKERRYCSNSCANEARSIASQRPKVEKTEKRCAVCGKPFEVWPSRAYYQYCSQQCRNTARRGPREARTSRVVTCNGCGKRFRKFKCRIDESENDYCSRECYTANGRIDGPTQPEIEFANKLDELGIPYEFQAIKGPFVIDFLVLNRIYVEINGCYWHGCPKCFSTLNETQKRKIRSDKRKRGYFKNKGLPLIEIWEHELESLSISERLNL